MLSFGEQHPVLSLRLLIMDENERDVWTPFGGKEFPLFREAVTLF